MSACLTRYLERRAQLDYNSGGTLSSEVALGPLKLKKQLRLHPASCVSSLDVLCGRLSLVSFSVFAPAPCRHQGRGRGRSWLGSTPAVHVQERSRDPGETQGDARAVAATSTSTAVTTTATPPSRKEEAGHY